MAESVARRVTRVLSPEQQKRLPVLRAQIASELPDLIERDRMRLEARSEPTLSGEFRRAIHGSSLSLSIIAQRAEIPPLLLDEFLTGERNVRSDVLDRLANVLEFVLHAKDCLADKAWSSEAKTDPP